MTASAQSGIGTDQTESVEILVGVNQGLHSLDAMALAVAAANTLDARIVVASVYPVSYDYPSPGHVDTEWRQFLVETAHENLAWARANIQTDRPVEYVIHPHRSSGVGLTQVARERKSDLIVIGSAPGGSDGRISGGSTSDQLLHGSPAPVAMAPEGFRKWAPERFDRVVIGCQEGTETDHAIEVTARVMQQAGIDPSEQLLLMTIVERVTRIYGSKVGRAAESQVLSALREQAQIALDAAASRLSQSTGEPPPHTRILQGDSIVSALSKFDWRDEDVLVLGSTAWGPLRRVFLGDMTYRILRASTVPTFVVPRSSA